jgi:hypothetical protein
MTGMKLGCPRCRCVLSLSAAETGRTLKCPRCAALFRWSAPRTMPGQEARAPWSSYAPVAGIAAVGLVLVGALVGYSYYSAAPNASESRQQPISAKSSLIPQKQQVSSPPVICPEPEALARGDVKPLAGASGSEERKQARAPKRPLPLLGDLAAAKRQAGADSLPAATDDEGVNSPAVPAVSANEEPQQPLRVAAPAKVAAVVPVVVPHRVIDTAMATEQPHVKNAIAKGTAYLRKLQNANGSWGTSSYLVGYTSMPALALLECGAPPKDPAVQKAAAFVRGYVPKLTATYELGLAILFLDRLGESRDKPLIQSMALRLVAGQNHVGGWTYHCPLLTQPEERELITFLRRNQPRPPLNPLGPVLPPYLTPVTDPQPDQHNPIARSKDAMPNPLGNGKDTASQNPLAQPVVRPLLNPIPSKKEALQNPLSKPGTSTGVDASADKNLISPFKDERTASLIGAAKSSDGDDISNLKGIAKSNGVGRPAAEEPKAAAILPKSALKPKEEMPDDDTPRANLINRWPSVPDFVARLKNPNQAPVKPDPKSKGKGKGKKGSPHVDDNSNSQFAILGLWAARRHGVPMTLTLTRLDERYRSSQVATGGWEYRYMGKSQTPAMTCVGLLGLGLSHGAFHEAMNPDSKKATEPRVRQLHADPAIQLGLQALGGYIGVPAGARPANAPPPAMQNLYFLWSVERVAVLYNLKTLGNKDWYAWGSEVLIAHQAADGSWLGGGYPGSNHTIDTCMALMFLRRSNLTRDLSNNLPPYLSVRDPGK